MPRMCMQEFIAIYEKEPCLWLVKSREYRNKRKKEAAYARLASVLSRIEPGADKGAVVRKINNLRSAYRKEKKKIQYFFERTGEIYQPKLWYFDSLKWKNRPTLLKRIMAPRKQFTAEQLAERKRLAERRRRERRNNDAILRKLDKIKEHERYERRKQSGQIKLIAQLSAREQLLRRKRSREHSRKYYLKKKSQQSLKNTQFQRDRSKLYRDLVKERSKNSTLSISVQRFEKKYPRLLERIKKEEESTAQDAVDHMLRDSSTEGGRFLEDQEDLEQLSVSATDNAGNDSCDEAGESSEDVGISLDWKPGIRSESISDFPDQYRQSYSTSQVDVGQFVSRSIVIKEDLDAESPTRIVEVPSEMKNSAEQFGSEDRFDLIGKTVALKLRNLPKGQMLIAENLIHQVLFQAELETLSFQHRIVGETRRNQDEYCYQAQNSTE